MRHHSRGERGASMVEVALTFPLFILLVFGIIEFSYATAQNNEIRRITREATRELGVNPTANALTLVCNGFDLIDPANVRVALTTAGAVTGETAELDVIARYRALTGFFDGMLTGVELRTTHRFAIDQPFGGRAPRWAPANDFGRTPCP